MSRRLFFSFDDEDDPVVQRYESYLSGSEKGYFDVEEFEQIIEYYLRNGRTRDGDKAIEIGLKLHPNNSLLQIKRAKIHLAKNEILKADRILNSLATSDDIEISLLRIEIALRSGKNNHADKLTKKLIEENYTYLDALCIDISLLYIDESEYEKAIKILLVGKNANSKNIDLLFELAFCYEQTNDYDAAITTYNNIIDIQTYNSEAWSNLGQIYYLQSKFYEALEAYDYALTINSEDSFACLQKAHSFFQLEDYENAIKGYQDYMQMTNDKEFVISYIAESFEKICEYEKAIQYYKEAILINGENYDLLCGISFCLLELEKFDESISYINKAIDIQEENAEAWVYLAEAYIGTDNIAGALLAYVQAITIDPNQPDTLLAIANICLETAEYEMAIEYYYAAMNTSEIFPENIHLLIAIAAYNADKLEIASLELKKSLEQNLDSIKVFLEICPDAEKFIENLHNYS